MMMRSMNRRTLMLALALGIAVDSWAFGGRYSAATVRGAHEVGTVVLAQQWRTVLTS